MLIIDETDTLVKWVGENLPEHFASIHLDLGAYEVASGLQLDITLINYETLMLANEEVLLKLKSCEGVLVYNPENKNLNDIDIEIVHAFNDESDCKQLSALLKKLDSLASEKQFLKSDLITLDRELGDLYHALSEELHRVKSSYEKKFPKRFEEIKGIKFYGKYAAGNNMGTDFYDLIETEDEIIGILCSSDSYLVSTSIVSFVQDLKGQGSIDAETESLFFEKIYDEQKKLSGKRTINVDVLFYRLNLSTLELSFRSNGHFGYIIDNEGQTTFPESEEISSSTVELERGSRVLINSTGFYKNELEPIPVSKVEELMGNKNVKSLDILDEIYFQLKKSTEDGIIEFDSSSIIIEVNPNVMVSV